MRLNEIADNASARKSAHRVGRGIGSGSGKTAGRGHKGQKSRSGVAVKGKGFEGGQMPLYRRLPKRGFTNPTAKSFQELTVTKLQTSIDSGRLDAGKPITEAILVESGTVRRLLDGVRLIGSGELKAKVEIAVTGATKGAIAVVEKAGGKVTVTAVPKPEKSDAPKKKKAAKAKQATAAEEPAEKDDKPKAQDEPTDDPSDSDTADS
jgi:large subunit ribosomal protein L15